MYQFRVSADITFTAGVLAGTTIEGGSTLSAPDYEHAELYAARIDDAFADGVEVKAAAGSSRYRYASKARITVITAEG